MTCIISLSCLNTHHSHHIIIKDVANGSIFQIRRRTAGGGTNSSRGRGSVFFEISVPQTSTVDAPSSSSSSSATERSTLWIHKSFIRFIVSSPTNIIKMVTPCDVPVGVITGDNVLKLLQHAKDNGYAIPAFNCTR